MTMPREGETMNEWFNRWRAGEGQAPVPQKLDGMKMRAFDLSLAAWEGLSALALDFGYVKGQANNPNVTKLIEAIGQGVLMVSSPYGGAGLSAPSPDES